jgi:hypothetical protein
MASMKQFLPTRVVETRAVMQAATLKHRLRELKAIRDWEAAGRVGPAPAYWKQRLVRSFSLALSLRTLVETGTYLGEMVEASKRSFERIYSIELDEQLCRRARLRFKKFPHVEILCGDSGELLPEVCKNVDSPALFWLDAHYSAGVTARGSTDTPIESELRAVLDRGNRADVVLIDDAREFLGRGGYPSVDFLRDLVVTLAPDAVFSVDCDIIRIQRTAE